MAEVHKLTKKVEGGQEKSVLFHDSMAELHNFTKKIEVGQEKSVLEFQDSMAEVHKLTRREICTRLLCITQPLNIQIHFCLLY